MERYSEYKDSGVKWLGKIPSHWEVMPLKSFIKFEKGKTPKEFSDENNGLPYLTMDYLRSRDNKIVKYPISSVGLFKIEEFEALVLWDGANAGEFILSKKGYLGSTMAKISGYRKYYNNLYFYYFLKMLEPTSKNFANGTTIPHFDASILINYHYPIPPIDEQKAIGSYLDTATSEIDKAIAMQQKMIDLLNERKQIIIQNAVTKGLDENVEMKESGVEWIGRIPKHWEVRRGKFLFRVVNEYSTTGQEELLTVSDRTGITPRCMKNVNMFMSESLIGYKKCQKGDICSNIMWMWHGAVGVTEYNGVISPSYGVYRQIAVNYDNKYLDYMLRLPRLVEVYGICSTGLTESRLRLYPDDFMNIQFFIPPVEEQKSIVLQIQKQITDIEKSIRNAENLITLLQERKQIIINEVVTGKVRVS